MKRRLAVLMVVTGVAMACFVTAALAYTFAGPKTWLPGYDADSTYAVWYSATMVGKGITGYSSRITFIDGGGSWHWSATDTLPNTTTFNYDNGNYKAYCRNDDTVAYVASCWTN